MHIDPYIVIGSAIVGLLVGVLAAMVTIPLGLVAASRDQVGLDPASAAIRQARNCARAWWAKRSPTPMEYFSIFIMVVFMIIPDELIIVSKPAIRPRAFWPAMPIIRI